VTSHRCHITYIDIYGIYITFNTIKNGTYNFKKTYSSLPFVLFSPKKSTANAHRIICETYGENVIAIRTNVRIDLNDLKNDNFDIKVIKNVL